MKPTRTDLALGFFATGLAAALLAWIPFDAETWIWVRSRRSLTLGEGLAPTAAALMLLLGAGLLLREAFLGRGTTEDRITAGNLRYLAILLGIMLLCLSLMRWAGPLTVSTLNMLGGAVPEYRLLRSSPPWSYIGFILGGTVMVAALMALIEGRVRLRGLLWGLASVAAMIILYDFAIDDVQLPPSGDV